MDANDLKEFSAIMTGLSENLNCDFTPAGLKLRFEALKQFSIKEIHDASIKILKTRKYQSMPSVADYFEILEGSTESKAQIELMKVLDSLKHGTYKTIVFDDPVTQKLMTVKWNLPSWGQHVYEADLKWFSKEFIEAYQSLDGVRDQLAIEDKPDGRLKQLTQKIG